MIRRLCASDKAAFLEMVEEFYHSPAVQHAVNPQNFVDTFEEIMAENPYLDGFLIEREGEIAGYLLISLTYSNEAGGLVVWVEELFMKEKFRGMGLGKEAFRFLEERFAGKVKRFRLEVTRENTRASKLYQALGYENLEYLQMIKDEKED